MKNLILIVEDEPIIISYYARILSSEKYNMVIFTNAVDCYKFISNMKHFDSILCSIIDLKLGEAWSGYDLASAINLVCPKIPLVAISGYIADYHKLPDFDRIFSLALEKPLINSESISSILDSIKGSFINDSLPTMH